MKHSDGGGHSFQSELLPLDPVNCIATKGKVNSDKWNTLDFISGFKSNAAKLSEHVGYVSYKSTLFTDKNKSELIHEGILMFACVFVKI